MKNFHRELRGSRRFGLRNGGVQRRLDVLFVPALRSSSASASILLARSPRLLTNQTSPFTDLAILLLDTGVRVGEALNLQTTDIHLEPAPGAKYGYLHVRDGKSKYAKRNVSLSARVTTMLRARLAAARSPWVFDNGSGGPYLGTSLNHQHSRVRTLLKLPQDFVIHSFRYTMLTRLGEAGADAFTIMRIAGHSSVTVSQWYVHPSQKSLERAFERLEASNTAAQAPKIGVGIDSGIVANPEAVQSPAMSLQ